MATLIRDRSDVVMLTYDGAESGGRSNAIAWSLPRFMREARSVGGAIPAFFAGLLPEGVRLGAVVTATKTSVDDHFTLLLAVGGDAIGNVRVVPAGTGPQSLPVMIDEDRIEDLTAVFRRLAGDFGADPVALPGVQPKASAAMWSVPAATTAGAAILKLTPPSGFPRLVENEHFFMTMASACGVRSARTRIVHDVDGRSGLLVERFDRRGGTRVAQEDACQVLDVYPASKYRIKAETAIAAIADVCEAGGGSRMAATLELLRIVAFSWLIGNGDLHGKNLSCYAPDGLWMPTPAYDLVTTQPYLRWRDPMAMDLYGRANRLRRQDFVDAATRLGLRAKAVERMLDELIAAALPWSSRCVEIGFDERDTERLQTMMIERATSLSTDS
nr:type II toxin-antitoxin system HipA family toxin [Gordonia phthalatica]